MKSIANRLVLFGATALFLGTAAYGQTALKADIPFAFRIPGGVAPAGTYRVQPDFSTGSKIMRLSNYQTRRSLLSVGFSLDNNPTAATAPRLVFRCGDEGCQLSEVWTYNGGYGLPVKRVRTHEYLSSIPLTVSHGD